LMLYRTATILYGRALAWAMTGDLVEATKTADRFDSLRQQHRDEAESRILHNNTVASLLELDAVMLRGELLYRQGKQLAGLSLLRKAVTMQDALQYDERKEPILQHSCRFIYVHLPNSFSLSKSISHCTKTHSLGKDATHSTRTGWIVAGAKPHRRGRGGVSTRLEATPAQSLGPRRPHPSAPGDPDGGGQ
jgi:hypothetical protein